VTVTVALAVDELDALLVAVIVCVPTVDGAVYSPDVLMVPTVEFPPTMLSTLQFTVGSVAIKVEPKNCTVPAVATLAVRGLIEVTS
jgi:hypothetical protein